MIISASYRTDIPAFYGGWFMNRLKAGFAEVRNPYGGQVSRVDLSPEAVDAFVFWTKNLGPFMERLPAIRRDYPFTVQYSINAYPRALEARVTDAPRAAGHMKMLAADYGPRVAVWRYDPIILTAETPPDWHVENFKKLAGLLEGTTDEVVTSFLEPYRKTARNMKVAGIDWQEAPLPETKGALLEKLRVTARDHGMALTLCTQPALVTDVLPGARCIDARRLSDVAGRDIRANEKGNREGCLCHESRDIGAYDSCPHGCIYCYAVSSPAAARKLYRAHDPEAAML